MANAIIEDTVEQAALSWFAELDYSVLHGPDIAPGEPGAERASYGDVVLLDRLHSALARINPTVPAEALEDAVRKVLRVAGPDLVGRNRSFHTMLTDGVD